MAPFPKNPAAEEAMTHNAKIRMEPTMWALIIQAGRDTDMTATDWVRQVLRSALDLHAQQMEAINHDPEDDIPDPSDPSYAEYVRRAAAEQRERIEAENAEQHPKEEKPERKLNVRDCPHLHKHRVGGRCGRCGLPVSQMVTSATGGRFGGRR